jgi:hypothetical protein
MCGPRFARLVATHRCARRSAAATATAPVFGEFSLR